MSAKPEYLGQGVSLQGGQSACIVSIVSLLIKNDVKSKCDYYGFEIDNKFVIGYGLDINNLFRDLNHIYIKKDEER